MREKKSLRLEEGRTGGLGQKRKGKTDKRGEEKTKSKGS
jgi:hypothetical protein